MNSLRTDDILGAMPRVRHMPKNLIRERRPPSNYLNFVPQYQPTQPYVNSQRQNNQSDGYPFYPRNILTKQPKQINYQSSRYQTNSPNQEYVNRSMQRVGSESLNISQRVQSPPLENARLRSSNDSGINKAHQQSNMEKQVNRSKVQSRSSSQNHMPLTNQPGRIFRGLGYNIISNHRFQYSFHQSKQ